MPYIALRLPILNQGGFQFTRLLVACGEGDGEPNRVGEQAIMAAQLEVRLTAQVVEQTAAGAGGGYAHIQAGVYLVRAGSEPQRINAAPVSRQRSDFAARERAQFPFEAVFQGEEVHCA